MRKLRVLALAAVYLAAASTIRADSSLTGGYSTGNGYRGWDGKGRLDLDKDAAWTVTGGFTYAHSFAGTESRSKQAVLGLEHVANDNWSFRCSATAWKDYISLVKYGGPSWGFTYTNTAGKTRKTLSWEQNKDEEAPPEEIYGVSFDNDLFYYQTAVTASSTSVRVKGQKVVIPPSSSKLTVGQWHPTLEFEVPFFSETITPSATVGHYFYTRDPIVIANRAGNPRFGASSGGLNSLAGGFFKNNGQAALDVRLPLHMKFHAALGAEQSATDNTWATTQEISLKTTTVGLVRVNLTWDRLIQAGQTSDQYTGGLTIYF